ncbi:MAG: 23S rRNA (adenine(2503)-C(2))-methyltransferase RlmN, partial [Calditrichaeota bacterium]
DFSPKKITISTSGITPKIKKLADSGLKARLALSLHAATQEKRVKIMPVAETFGLEKLMKTIKYYTEKTRTRVTLEYIIFKDFNDTKEDIKALAKLIHGIPCKINLLAYNPVDGLDFERPSDERVDWFGKELAPKVPAVTIRKSRGRDIDAACGQLAAKQRLRRDMHA